MRDEERRWRLGNLAARGLGRLEEYRVNETRHAERNPTNVASSPMAIGTYHPFSIIALSSSHLPPNPASGGRPDMATMAIAAAAKVKGMGRARPPRSANVRAPVRRKIAAATRNRIPLVMRWLAVR